MMKSFICFGKVSLLANALEVDEPQLPRHRKRPNRYEEGTSARSYPSNPKDLLIWLLHVSKTDLINQATRYTTKQKS